MNKHATIVPVFGIGALVSGLTLIDDNESNVKSLFSLGGCSFKYCVGNAVTEKYYFDKFDP